MKVTKPPEGLEIPPGMQLNEPTDEGRALGKEMARLVSDEIAKTPGARHPCGTCAFRAGSYPNGCPASLMDAIKCAHEKSAFRCHESGRYCAGWLALARNSPEPMLMPWPFSYSDSKTPEVILL